MRSALILMIAVFCSGCESVFLNPLSNPHNARIDRHLLGRWQGKDKENKDAYLEFAPGSNGQTNISMSGVEPPEHNPVFTMFSTKLGSHTYMNLNPTDEDRDKGYLIARYAITGNQLTVWIINPDKIKPAILQGRLKGKAGEALATTTVSDTTQNVAAFVGSADGDELFEYFGTFVKTR